MMLKSEWASGSLTNECPANSDRPLGSAAGAWTEHFSVHFS